MTTKNRLTGTARVRAMAFVACLGAACGQGGPSAALAPTRSDDPASTTAARALAIDDVTVLAMTSPNVLEHQTVLVRDGTIEWIASTGSRAIPSDAVVVRGDGRVLMPALVDMHVHVREADLRAYVSHGIGTVRNMWGFPGALTMSSQIADGSRFGPRIYSVSSGLDAPPAQWPLTQFVTTPAEAHTVVQGQKSAGYRELKLYTNLSPAMFDTILAVARTHGMSTLGHVPFRVDIRRALESGMRSIEHFTGYDRAVSRTGRAGTSGWADADETRFASLVDATVAAGVWNCPTLAIFAALSEQHTASERTRIVASRQRFVRLMHERGARLLAGSDAGIDVVAPGSSLHDELDQFVAAGLTPYAALRIATTLAAEMLGLADVGVITAGARADLLLLAENPLLDVSRARRIGGVVLGGSWTPQRELSTRTGGWR